METILQALRRYDESLKDKGIEVQKIEVTPRGDPQTMLASVPSINVSDAELERRIKKLQSEKA